MYYTRKIKKVKSFIEWAKAFENSASRIIAKTNLEDGIQVSTVFLGIDHSFSSKPHVPILFETMIFGGKHHDYQVRYFNRLEAIKGHEKAVKLALKG